MRNFALKPASGKRPRRAKVVGTAVLVACLLYGAACELGQKRFERYLSLESSLESGPVTEQEVIRRVGQPDELVSVSDVEWTLAGSGTDMWGTFDEKCTQVFYYELEDNPYAPRAFSFNSTHHGYIGFNKYGIVRGWLIHLH